MNYFMVKHLNFSLSDVYKMPIQDRDVYFDLFKREMEEKRKQQEKQAKSNSSSIKRPVSRKGRVR